jgi:hypothetical protein
MSVARGREPGNFIILAISIYVRGLGFREALDGTRK